MCVANTYVVRSWRRGDWYIWLRDVGTGASVTTLPGAQQACLILRTRIRSQDVRYVAKT